jgi:hypothetical protein
MTGEQKQAASPYEWKSLANAIIHDGFDPTTSVTIIACERCQNKFMRILLSNDFSLLKSEYSKNRNNDLSMPRMWTFRTRLFRYV